jgi:type II secretory pathway pseudopilin PulG
MQPPATQPSTAVEPANPYASPAELAVEPKTSALAIAGFVMSLLPFCMIHLVGLILGAVAWAQINNRPQELKGKGLAIAAVAIGSLWLVIVVVGIIAAIAIPSFLGYQAKAHQAEARSNLNAIHSAEKAYFAEHERYADSFDTLEWRPLDDNYTYYLGDGVIAPAGKRPEPLPSDVATFANREGFQAAAVGNIDEDPTLDVWVIGDDGWADNIVDDSFQCICRSRHPLIRWVLG